ncbi:MAG: hypothetical protein NVS4B7_11000 [Ktedonobacteraceae bacterium]
MSATPRRLGKYELQQLLGHGSTGEVWKGYDHQTSRNIAIKLLHPDLLQSDPNFMTTFLTEWQYITTLRHPNIVPVHEVHISRPSASDDDNGSGSTTPYIVMEYIEGHTSLLENIQHTSRAGNFPAVADIVYLFTSIGQAIDYAHEQGLVHGNIKPGNILLDTTHTQHISSGEPMLTDFGIAKLPGSKHNIAPAYLSPEQVKEQEAGPRSDIYSLGIILYEMCTGVLPFHDESHVAIMMHHLNTLPTPPILINPSIPAELSEVILRALAKNPDSRFPTACLLAEAIAEACAVEQTAHLTSNKMQARAHEFHYYPGNGSLRPPATPKQSISDMTSILGVAQP